MKGPFDPKGVETRRLRNDALETMFAVSRAICYLAPPYTTPKVQGGSHLPCQHLEEAEAGEL